LDRLIEMFTVNPARLLSLDSGTLSTGAAADVTLIDPDLEWTFDREKSQSLSRNTPFHGAELKGRAVRTIVAGKTVWARED
jgi:dihydroorotase